MKTLVLAEKPSVGKDIAKVLNCHSSRNGCILDFGCAMLININGCYAVCMTEQKLYISVGHTKSF